MANRYTNLTPATFNPLSAQEIMMVPMMKQRQHEMQQAQLGEASQFDINRLATDEEAVSSGINDITGGIRDLEEELYKSGTNKNIARKLMELRRKKQSFISNEGIGGQAKAAYLGFQQNYKDIMSNSKMNQQDKQAAIRFMQQEYDKTGGVAKGAQYTPYAGFNSQDIPKRLAEYGSKLKPYIRKTSGWHQDEKTGIWINGNQKTTQLPRDVINNALLAVASNDPEIMNYLKEKQRVYGEGYNPANELSGAIQGVSGLFVRDDREYTEGRNFSQVGKEEENARNVYDLLGLPGGSINPNYNLDNITSKSRDEDYILQSSGFSNLFIPQITKRKNMKPGEKEVFNISKNIPSGLKDIPGVYTPKFGFIPNTLTSGESIDNTVEHWKQRGVDITDPVQNKAVSEYISKYENYGNQGVKLEAPPTKAANRKVYNEMVESRVRTPGTKMFVNGELTDVERLRESLGYDEGENLNYKELGDATYTNPVPRMLPEGAEHLASSFYEPIAISVRNKKKNRDELVFVEKRDSDYNPGKASLAADIGQAQSSPDPIPMQILMEDNTIATLPVKWRSKEYFEEKEVPGYKDMTREQKRELGIENVNNDGVYVALDTRTGEKIYLLQSDLEYNREKIYGQ